MANYASIFAWTTIWSVRKAKRYDRKMRTPRLEWSNMLLEKRRGQLLIAPGRMKRLAKAKMTVSCGCVWW